MKKVTLFSTLPLGSIFQNLYGQTYYKIDEVRALKKDTDEYENFPSEELVYIDEFSPPILRR